MTPKQEKTALQPLIDLAHHRWNIPVLAELQRRSGAKFVTLAKTLGVSRNSLSATLSDLMDKNLVMKNPGHGHPMRPEYLLTKEGEAVGRHCVELADLIDRHDAGDIGYRKWTLPLVVAIGDGVQRFGEVRAALGDQATPRAMTMGLKSMLSAHWVKRLLIDDYPPTAAYCLTAKGRRVLQVANTFCR